MYIFNKNTINFPLCQDVEGGKKNLEIFKKSLDKGSGMGYTINS